MKTADFFNGRVFLGVLVIVLTASLAVQSEELPLPSAAVDTNRLSDIEENAVSEGPQPAEIDPDSAYGELVRLFQAGVDQSVILTYVENSLRFFELNADRIIYLSDLGAPSGIIEAAMERDKQLLQKGIAPAAAPSAQETDTTTNPPPEVTVDYFYDTLAPYGTWVYVEGYGRCWRPTVVIYDAGWRPYCDNGRWVYTDCGWYWMSDYTWGWAAFHYGRWFRHDRYGWCWWPDTVWSPSWVSWRYDRTYCGWAPLPPYTSYRSGIGIVYRGSRVSVGFNFGLDSDCYTFVPTRNFCDPKPRQHCLDGVDAKRIYDRTSVFNRIDYDAQKKSLVNSGISPNIISTLSDQDITPVTVRHAGSRTGTGGRYEQLNGNEKALVVSRPDHGIPQKHRDPARISSSAQRKDPLQHGKTYAATAELNSRNPGGSTAYPHKGSVQRAQSYNTRQPTPAPQSTQKRAMPLPDGATPQQPVNQRPATPQRDNEGASVSQGYHSDRAASGQAQKERRNTRAYGPPSGKPNDAARGNKAPTYARPDVSDGGR